MKWRKTTQWEEVDCTLECLSLKPDGIADVQFIDPVVHGSGTYVSSYDSMTYNASYMDNDGTHRYVEETFGFDEAVEPMTPPDSGAVKTYRFRSFVRPGDDDNPENIVGDLWYEVLIELTSSDTNVTFTPGENTSEFSFSFDKSQSQIEQDIFDNLYVIDSLVAFTARVTVLSSEGAMPRITIFSVDDGGLDNYPAVPSLTAHSLPVLLLLLLTTGLIVILRRRVMAGQEQA